MFLITHFCMHRIPLHNYYTHSQQRLLNNSIEGNRVLGIGLIYWLLTFIFLLHMLRTVICTLYIPYKTYHIFWYSKVYFFKLLYSCKGLFIDTYPSPAVAINKIFSVCFWYFSQSDNDEDDDDDDCDDGGDTHCDDHLGSWGKDGDMRRKRNVAMICSNAVPYRTSRYKHYFFLWVKSFCMYYLYEWYCGDMLILVKFLWVSKWSILEVFSASMIACQEYDTSSRSDWEATVA